MNAAEYIKAFDAGDVNPNGQLITIKMCDNVSAELINNYVEHLELGNNEDHKIVCRYLKAFYNVVD